MTYCKCPCGCKKETLGTDYCMGCEDFIEYRWEKL